jgi:undecaprenyl-diphosphatase
MESVLEAMLLGLIQGLTEFLPVSSSGHLALFQRVLGWRDVHGNLSFNIAVHSGSLVAVILFLRRDIVDILTRCPRLIVTILVATLPVALVVFATDIKQVVRSVAHDTVAVGMLLLVTASLLLATQTKREGSGTSERLPFWKAALVGCAQVFAVLPGISRSGVTLAAGVGLGLTREQALRFAFLLAIPVIGGATLVDLVTTGWSNSVPTLPLVAGTVVSFLASLVAMRVLLNVVRRGHLGFFAAYCAAAGILAVIWGMVS